MKFGIVGLGSGAMMCHSQEGDDFRFFEIDADVVFFDPDLDFVVVVVDVVVFGVVVFFDFSCGVEVAGRGNR